MKKNFIWLHKDEKKIKNIVDFFDETFTEKYLYEYRKGEYPREYEMDALMGLRMSDYYSNGAINVIFNYCLKSDIDANISNILEIVKTWDHSKRISTRYALQLIREYDQSLEKIKYLEQISEKR